MNTVSVSDLNNPDQTRAQSQVPFHLLAADISSEASKSIPKSAFFGNLGDLRSLILKSQSSDGPSVVRGYKLLQEIGYGGFGTVWEALDENTDEHVAVKFFLRDRSDATKVLKEVEYMTKVQGCFGIVPVKSVEKLGTEPHFIPYYVMQFAPKGSLAHFIEKHRPSLREQKSFAIEIATTIAKTMSFMHNHGIVHSDLKPGNILVNDANQPLIADFGQAQRGSESSAQGTFFYMPPERATLDKQKENFRWDVYGFGAILYAMLTGQPPRYQESTERELKKRKYEFEDQLHYYRETISKTPLEQIPWIDSDLQAILNRCLAIDPLARPANGMEILQLLQARSVARRKRPLIRMARLVTAASVLTLLVLYVLFAKYLYTKEHNICIKEVEQSLLQRTFLSTEYIEDRLSRRVQFVERMTDLKNFPMPLRRRLHGISQTLKNHSDPKNPVACPDYIRVDFDDWIENHCLPELTFLAPSEHRSMGIMVCADVGRGQNASPVYVGQFLSRIDSLPNVATPAFTAAQDRDQGKNGFIYSRNWSFRDYFNGQGNDFEHENDNRFHPVIRSTHISHAYKSRVVNAPWKIDISTPIYLDPADPNSPIIGVFISGIHVKESLEAALEYQPSKYSTSQNPEASSGDNVDYVIVNDRANWAWHEVEMTRFDHEQSKLPIRKDPGQYMVSTIDDIKNRIHAKQDPGQEVKKVKNQSLMVHDWIDEMKGPQTHFAQIVEFHPYRFSKYETQNKNKTWLFINEIETENALRPAYSLFKVLVGIGIAIPLLLVLIISTMWYWLIRHIRMTEAI